MQARTERGDIMCKAIDVANFFVDLALHDEEEIITNMKLNKLLYFAQGHYLAKYGKPLFAEKIEAWQHGPVIPSVYHAFKVCGKNPIATTNGEYTADIFTAEEIDFLVNISLEYGCYTASTLRDMTHEYGTPWYNIYEPHRNLEITTNNMTEYFKQHDFDSFDLSTIEPTGGYINKEGHAILPMDWNDNEDEY